jgi:predicted ArsR family transcriptional regulator
MDLGNQAAGIGALADETRRALYEYVVAQPHAVGREEAATALSLAPHNAKFHLDRLVDEGLLVTEYRRLNERTGPGAGRPSKLYRRAPREFAVSLPARHYDLVGEILADAVAQAAAGSDLDAALEASAREEGVSIGTAAREEGAATPAPDAADDLRALSEVLGSQGYEPRVEDDVVVLANCPFDALAKRHTALVCGLNRTFVQGVADGLGCAGVEARLEPEDGHCCVKAHRAP